MTAVVMAGGKGTRLREITRDEIPKPMAPIGGKPILQRQIETLREQGITRFILIIGHLGSRIKDYFQDGSAFGVHISYVEEHTPLGTAGALPRVLPLLDEDCFFLAFGDVLFEIDLERMLMFHREHKAVATLFIHPNTHPYDSDLVICEENGKVLGFDSKHNSREDWYHNCVNAGLYLLDRAVCRRCPPDIRMDLEKDLLASMIEGGIPVCGYRSSEYVKDVGTVERIRRAEEELLSGFVSRRSLKHKQKAIFLDRDGTINRKNGLIFRESQLELEEGAAQAVRRINGSGYLAVVVTNQPVVARGLCSVEDVDRLHCKLETLLGQEGAYLDDIYFCPHHPDKGYPEENPDYKIPCRCRKPDTEMLEWCAEKYNIDLSASWMIGDTTVDVQTGKNAGTKTALVLTGDGGRDGKYPAVPDLICRNLLEAVCAILKE